MIYSYDSHRKHFQHPLAPHRLNTIDSCTQGTLPQHCTTHVSSSDCKKEWVIDAALHVSWQARREIQGCWSRCVSAVCGNPTS
eukprot:1154320-Pelagomonas_calceolata.AAC.4